MFNLHAVELGWPVPIPSGHSFDDGEAGLMDSAFDAAVMAQGDFTGDKLLEVLEMAVPAASGLFGGRHGIFREMAQRKAAQTVPQTEGCRRRSGMRAESVVFRGGVFGA